MSTTDVREGELLPAAADTELVTVQGFATLFDGFFGGLKPFFDKARELEQDAIAAVGRAKLLTVTDLDSHQRLLEELKARKEHKRQAEKHWDITTRISGFHKLLTGRRGVTTGADDLAITELERKDREWTAAETRRVAAENARREAEERERLRLEQEAEANRMEQEALAREAASANLSANQQAFVTNMVNGMPQGRAAKSAGYKDAEYADTLLAMTKITDAIEAGKTAKAIREQAAAVRSQPVATPVIERVEASVGHVKGLGKSYTHIGHIRDLEKFRRAYKAGEIPIDAMVPDQSTMNAYAKAMGARLNAWPGVEYEKKEGSRG